MTKPNLAPEPVENRPRGEELLEHDEHVDLVDDPLLAGSLGAIARDQLGFLTKAQLRGHGVTARSVATRVRARPWRRAARGIVDVADDPDSLGHGVTQKRDAVLALLAYGPSAIAVGLTALTILGVWGVPIGRPAQVSLPRAGRRDRRVGLVCRRFEQGVVPIVVHGVRVVPPVVALAQAICEVSPRTALGLLDSALHRGVITVDQLADVQRATRGRRGCRRLELVWYLVDGRRASPPESGAWYDLWEVNLEPTDVQIEMYDGEVLVARPDFGYLLDDGSWLFVEIDGDDYHQVGNEHDPARDHRLEQLLASRGVSCEILRFRSPQLGFEGEMTETIREKIAGRRWLRRRRRRSLE